MCGASLCILRFLFVCLFVSTPPNHQPPPPLSRISFIPHHPLPPLQPPQVLLHAFFHLYGKGDLPGGGALLGIHVGHWFIIKLVIGDDGAMWVHIQDSLLVGESVWDTWG